jgi:Ni/Fe-hydrogenase subunit HybB-like protein
MTQSSVLSPQSFWLWLLVGFTISTGIANGMLAWAAALRVAQARWAASVTRIGAAAIAFVPVSAAVLVVLLIGVRAYAPWIAHPVPDKAAWLNVQFFVIREIALLGVFWGLSFMMVRWGLSADAKSSRGEEITDSDHHRLNVVACAAIVMYAIASSVVSYDFIMSLSPEWTSTMFAPYFFCTNLYAAMATIIFLAAWLRRPLGLEKTLGPSQFHDMGNLLLAFSLFNMGLFFAQYLTIWYENLPEETHFIILRYYKGPWPYVGWTAFIMGYAVPFIFLQSRKLKENHRLLAPVAFLAIVGVALERYVLIAPSFYPEKSYVDIGIILIPAALFVLLILAIFAFFRRYSPVSSADEALAHMEPAEEPI